MNKGEMSHWALVLVYSSGAIITNVLVAKGFFDTIPKSLEDAARMDGASHMKVFLSIMIPLSKPMLTYASLMIFNGCFVDFIFADLVLRTEETRTLAVGLFRMVNQSNSTEFTLFAAGAVLVALPVTLLFIFLQRFLVDGLTAGASKGYFDLRSHSTAVLNSIKTTSFSEEQESEVEVVF